MAQQTCSVLTKPSGVVSVEARPPGIGLESTIIHEGPSWCLLAIAPPWACRSSTYNLVEALCCSQTGRTSTDDENVDVAVRMSAHLWAGRMRGGEAVNVHFFLVGSHGALQNFLEAGDSFQCLASVIQHSPGGRAEGKAIEQSAGGAVARGDWGVV